MRCRVVESVDSAVLLVVAMRCRVGESVDSAVLLDEDLLLRRKSIALWRRFEWTGQGFRWLLPKSMAIACPIGYDERDWFVQRTVAKSTDRQGDLANSEL